MEQQKKLSQEDWRTTKTVSKRLTQNGVSSNYNYTLHDIIFETQVYGLSMIQQFKESEVKRKEDLPDSTQQIRESIQTITEIRWLTFFNEKEKDELQITNQLKIQASIFASNVIIALLNEETRSILRLRYEEFNKTEDDMKITTMSEIIMHSEAFLKIYQSQRSEWKRGRDLLEETLDYYEIFTPRLDLERLQRRVKSQQDDINAFNIRSVNIANLLE